MKATFTNIHIGTKVNFVNDVLTITEINHTAKIAVAEWESGGKLFIFGDTQMNGLTITKEA